MKRSKNKAAPDQTHEMIAFFRALSDPSRFRLVKLLTARPKSRAGGSCGDGLLCVNALAYQLNITQSAPV